MAVADTGGAGAHVFPLDKQSLPPLAYQQGVTIASLLGPVEYNTRDDGYWFRFRPETYIADNTGPDQTYANLTALP